MSERRICFESTFVNVHGAAHKVDFFWLFMLEKEGAEKKVPSLSLSLLSSVLPRDLFVIGERRSQIQTKAAGQAACRGGVELCPALQLVESRKYRKLFWI